LDYRGRVSWRKYLLIPRLVLSALGAPRSQAQAWERYWSTVRSMGPEGEVLWDTGQPAEFELTAAQLRQHADLTLPIVDLGCGSGRQARSLTALAPRVVGIDGSAAAIAHARRTAAGVDFRVADIAEPGLGARLAAELGEVNVHIRGVLHVMDDDQRRTVVDSVAALLGSRGTLYLCETNHAGDALDYLVAQGARPTRLPAVVDRLVRSGVRAPRHFGPAELTGCFPPSGWQVLASGPTVLYGTPVQPGGALQHIPALFALLRRSGYSYP
jgi:SAM-dependent methyltransferase